jgi:uncharacterized protein YecE (DUF72 family)
MAKTLMDRIKIGTSGWDYDHWEGVFYPTGLDPKGRFAYYTKFFNTVEIIYSFFHIPHPWTLESWKKEAPHGFQYSFQALRHIVYTTPAKEMRDLWEEFGKRARILEEKLGVILILVPFEIPKDERRLAQFLKEIPEGIRVAFEFRHPTWRDKNVRNLLKAYNVAYCITSSPDSKPNFIATADFVYVRLHGSKSWHSSSYSTKQLKGYAKKIVEFAKEGKDIYVYFNNDYRGYAVQNAQTLLRLVSQLI